jgi:LysM repeat protein
MTIFVKAKYHENALAAEYVTSDNRHVVRSGGSLPWRLNNCGNLRSPEDSHGVPNPKKTKNFIGLAKSGAKGHHFFIFPDYETGRAELKASLLRKYSKHTLAGMVAKYAPSPENNTAQYIKQLCEFSGLEETVVIGELSPAGLKQLMDGIERKEGYSKDAALRKEVEVNVSRIQATDGTRPVANEEIVVKQGDKTTTLKSNAAGIFPLVVHGKEQVTIQHKTADGELKTVGELPQDKGVLLNLTTKVAEFFGRSAPVKPPETPIKGKQPFEYIVKQNDILGRLAVEFKTTVAIIQRDNNLKTTNIMPGQRLGIHGPLTPGMPRARPKQALATAPAPAAAAKPAAPPPAKPAAAAAQPAPAPAKPAATPAKPASTPAAAPTAPATKPKKVPTEEKKATPARSKAGSGEPLATLPLEDGIAPWMKHAIAEAKRFRGVDEAVIQETRNYHTELRTGRKVMTDSDNAWCAAFVNWNLWQAGYPVENPKSSGLTDRADIGRAHGIMNVNHIEKQPDKKKSIITSVDNPLFYEIDEPVYGAIAVVVGKHSGRGHHTGFVYGKVKDNFLCVLGGNQGSTIRFTPTNILPYPAEIDPKTKKKRKNTGSTDFLKYYLPRTYKNPDNNGPEELKTVDFVALNREIGILPPAKAPTERESSR